MQCKASLGCTAKGFGWEEIDTWDNVRTSLSLRILAHSFNFIIHGFWRLKMEMALQHWSAFVVDAAEDVLQGGWSWHWQAWTSAIPPFAQQTRLNPDGCSEFRLPCFVFFWTVAVPSSVSLQCNTANCACPLLQAIFIHVFVPRADISDCYL